VPNVSNLAQARSGSLNEGFSLPEREFLSLSEIDCGDLISVFQMLLLVGYFKWLSMMHDKYFIRHNEARIDEFSMIYV